MTIITAVLMKIVRVNFGYEHDAAKTERSIIGLVVFSRRTEVGTGTLKV